MWSRMRGKFLARTLVTVLFAVLLLHPVTVGAQQDSGPEIKLVLGQNVSERHKQLFERFVPLAQSFFKKALGRPKVLPATIYVYASRGDRVQGYAQIKGVTPEVAERVLRSSLVTANRSQEIWYRLDDRCFSDGPQTPGCNFVKILFHEMFHLWQFEFAQDINSITARWIVEGSAEYIGYLGAVELPFLPQIDVDRYLTAAAARRSQSFPGLDKWSTLEEWDTWSRTFTGDMFSISALAFFRLTGKNAQGLTHFYQILQEGRDWEKAFETAFGRPFAKFDEAFTAFVRSSR